MPSDRRDGTLETLEERTLLELPRGRDGRERLRVTFARARTPEGIEVAWHGLRIWVPGRDGAMLPTRTGITIRSRELGPVVGALLRQVASSIPTELHGAARSIVDALTPSTASAPTAPATSHTPASDARQSSTRPAAAPTTREPLPHEEYAELRRRRGGR